jgi:spore maturation protein CgeB
LHSPAAIGKFPAKNYIDKNTRAPLRAHLDPDTHHPVERDARFAGDLAFLSNRLPDREARA